MGNKISVPRGPADILPSTIPLWHNIEKKARDLAQSFGYQEIRTPYFEDFALFKRSLGQTSEVVNKQLLELAGDQKDGFALRPEGTASIVRSYIENNLDRKESISKFYYLGAMFRGERPQKGRLRQFHQIGIEAIGPSTRSPFLDAEVIALAVGMLKSFGLNEFELKINTLGTLDDKNAFAKWLKKAIQPRILELSEEDKNRFERNVFRVLDSKSPQTQKVMAALDIGYQHLSSESREYFSQVKQALKNLNIPFTETPNLVRGLDYYTHTVFEITGSSLGSQDALGAGGRYSDLVEQLGGSNVDAIGFALGIERILLALGLEGETVPQKLDAFVIALQESLLPQAFALTMQLRNLGFSADLNFQVASVKSQMRTANKANAQHVLILGEEEAKEKVVTVKNFETGQQDKVSINQIEKFKNV